MANRGDGKGSGKSGGGGVSCLLIGAGLLVGGICVIGILASIAIPAFISYVKRSKTAEARSNLSAIYSSAAAYYEADHFGPGGRVTRGCSVGPAVTPERPGPYKSALGGLWPQPFVDLGFTPSDPLYYQYEIVAGPAHCGGGPNQAVYTFRAFGDLDGDGTLSTFELAAGSDATGRLQRSAGVHVVQELE